MIWAWEVWKTNQDSKEMQIGGRLSGMSTPLRVMSSAHRCTTRSGRRGTYLIRPGLLAYFIMFVLIGGISVCVTPLLRISVLP